MIQVKANQPGLLKSIKETVTTHPSISTFFSGEHSRGRQEKRITNIFPASSNISEDWSGIKRVIHVERLTSKNGKSPLLITTT